MSRAVRLILGAMLVAIVAEGAASTLLFVRDLANPVVDVNTRPARYDALLGWVGLPNFAMPDMFGVGAPLSTNADGMRVHRPVSAAVAPGVTRMICSGDSFTHGWGVGDSDTFCAQLERVLPHLETLNMAQHGFGIDQAWLWYRRDGGRYAHQLHLFAFIFNDFDRMGMRAFFGYPKPILRVEGDTLVVENTPVPRSPPSAFPATLQRVLPTLRVTQLVGGLKQGDTARASQRETEIQGVAEHVFSALEKLNAERGSQLVLVYLPTLSDLEPSKLDDRRARIERFASAAGIPFIDLTPDIRALPPDSSAWYFITPNLIKARGAARHYTVAGNRWVAARLAERLNAMPATRARLMAQPAGVKR